MCSPSIAFCEFDQTKTIGYIAEAHPYYSELYEKQYIKTLHQFPNMDELKMLNDTYVRVLDTLDYLERVLDPNSRIYTNTQLLKFLNNECHHIPNQTNLGFVKKELVECLDVLNFCYIDDQNIEQHNSYQKFYNDGYRSLITLKNYLFNI